MILKHCQYSIRLIKRLHGLDVDNCLDYDLINKSIGWAKKYHGDQKRKSGEPYYTHPLEVAYMLAEYKLKTDVIIAAILHDIVEDTEVTAGMILDEFGRRIEQMVDRLTRDRPDGSKLSVEQILDNAYEHNDQEVLLIKVVDRLHNILTLGVKSPNKISKTIDETLIHFIILSEYLDLACISRVIKSECIKNKTKLNIQQSNVVDYRFSFNDDYHPLSLAYQNKPR